MTIWIHTQMGAQITGKILWAKEVRSFAMNVEQNTHYQKPSFVVSVVWEEWASHRTKIIISNCIYKNCSFTYWFIWNCLKKILQFYFNKVHLFGTFTFNKLSSKSVVNNSAIREYFCAYSLYFSSFFWNKVLHMYNFLITKSLGLNAFKCTSEIIYILQSYWCSLLLTVIYIYSVM